MHLKADEPLARDVKMVLLNDKPVPECHEAHEEEGWVVSYVPDFEAQTNLLDTREKTDQELVEQAPRHGFKLVKRFGKVEIVF